MNEKKETASFELTYAALKMFGKQLYSNVGSAISELVANGLDAGAEEVFIVIDVRDKNNGCVEILDNGSGMSVDEIHENYVKIGFNKRDVTPEMAERAMGRKGIGKLAALFLSDTFTIATKKDDVESVWKLDVARLEDNSSPELVKIENLLRLVGQDYRRIIQSYYFLYSSK